MNTKRGGEKFSAGNKTFLLNGKKFFLYSGEIHYFRVDARLWGKHLKALKDAGCNTTSTYICWDWHEYEKGRFDFAGKTHPNRNLIGYLELCKKLGLYCIVKPGPYILAEYYGNGIPLYLLEEQKEIFAIAENSKIISKDIICLMNPKYLSLTYGWYDQVMPIIKKYQMSNGGPITMMQVCNEVGLQHWLSAQADFSPVVLELYRKYLKEKYRDISEYNRITGDSFLNFEKVIPPTGDVRNIKHFAAYNEWHAFWRTYFGLYLKTLVQKIRSYGIDLQLTHNVAGWIYGGASELPMVLTFYDEVAKSCPEISFGLDHIPEFMSFRNAHCDLPLGQILCAIQCRGPVWSAEFQAGSREHNVRNSAREMELFYKASLAHDLAGLNFYMFSQGENADGKGVFCKKFYWQTPLNVRGEKSALYDVVKDLGQYLRIHGEKILETEVKADIGIGFYKPYYYTELISSQIMARRKLDVGKIGLQYDPRFIRETIFFDGLLRCLQTLNYNYRIVDLQNVSVEEILKFKQFWVTTTEYMDEETQCKLSSAVKKGGHIVIYPCLPKLNFQMQSCTILKDEFGIITEKKASPNKISFLDISELYTFSGIKEIYLSERAEIIGRTADKDSCAIEKTIGEGKVTLISAAVGYSVDEHLRFYETLIQRAAVKRDVEISDPDVNAVLRRGKGYAYLFLLNYQMEDKKIKVAVPKDVLKEIGCRKSARFDVRLPAISAKILNLT